MKTESTNLLRYGKTTVGVIRIEQDGKHNRYVMCKGIHVDENGIYYAHWQYILKRTLKPSGKSTSFISKIDPQ